MEDDPLAGIDVGDLPDRLNEIADEPEPRLVHSYQPPDCQHPRSRVHRNERRCYCRDCEVELDPIQVLYDIAVNPTLWANECRAARAQAEHARNRLEDLLRQERNAKARLATLRKKLRDEAPG